MKLQSFLIKKGINRASLARYLSVSKACITRYLKEKNDSQHLSPSIENARKIEIFTQGEVPIEEFFGEAKAKEIREIWNIK